MISTAQSCGDWNLHRPRIRNDVIWLGEDNRGWYSQRCHQFRAWIYYLTRIVIARVTAPSILFEHTWPSYTTNISVFTLYIGDPNLLGRANPLTVPQSSLNQRLRTAPCTDDSSVLVLIRTSRWRQDIWHARGTQGAFLASDFIPCNLLT